MVGKGEEWKSIDGELNCNGKDGHCWVADRKT